MGVDELIKHMRNPTNPTKYIPKTPKGSEWGKWEKKMMGGQVMNVIKTPRGQLAYHTKSDKSEYIFLLEHEVYNRYNHERWEKQPVLASDYINLLEHITPS